MARDSKRAFYDVVLLLRFFANNQQFTSSRLFCGGKSRLCKKGSLLIAGDILLTKTSTEIQYLDQHAVLSLIERHFAIKIFG